MRLRHLTSPEEKDHSDACALGLSKAGCALHVSRKELAPVPCGRKRKRHKIATHKRKKKLRANRHKKKLR